MHRHVNQGLVSYRFETLPSESLSHAVFTRVGGVSRPPFATLNVGKSVGDDPASVAENHERIYRVLGILAARVVTGHQVHGNYVAVVTDRDAGCTCPKTDALVTCSPGLGLMLRFADCQPIVLYDPARHALGLLHAGWRGLAQGVAIRAVKAMEQAFGSAARDLIASLGPAIGPCCYEVGDNVASAMGYAVPSWRKVMRREGSRWRLDLPAANALQLAACGVTQIEEAGVCTSCHSDEFYSHRAEEGHTGRFAVLACLGPPPNDGDGDHSAAKQSPAADDASPTPGSLNPAGFPPFGEKPRPAHLAQGDSERRL